MRLQNMVEPSPCVTINQKFGMHSQYVTESDVASTEINVVAHLLMFVLYVRCQTCSVATNHINEWMKIRRRRRRHTHTNTRTEKSPRTNIQLHLLCSFVFRRNERNEMKATRARLRAAPIMSRNVFHAFIIIAFQLVVQSKQAQKLFQNLRSSLCDRFRQE